MESGLKVCISTESGNETLRLLGSRGTMDILCVFCCGTPVIRFTQLHEKLGYLSTKTLVARLRELEDEGFVTRTAYDEIPPRVEYRMTEKGEELTEVLMPLLRWVAKYSVESC